MTKNNARIQKLKEEFIKLQGENEDFDFAPDTDGFIDWIVGKLEEAETDLSNYIYEARERFSCICSDC